MSFIAIKGDYADKNICIRIEHKYRSKNVKFDITLAQEEDIFALSHTDRHYFMTKKQYLGILLLRVVGRRTSQKRFHNNVNKSL